MFGQFRHLLLTAVWGLSLATACGNAAMSVAIAPACGYLPQAGPLPLRFRPLPPPISDQDIAPAPPVAPITLPSPPMPSKEPVPIPAVTNAPPLEFKAETTPVQPPVAAPEQVVSPQMLIKYFTAPNSQTNAVTNAAPKALDPVGFTSPLGGGAPPPSKPAPAAPPNQK